MFDGVLHGADHRGQGVDVDRVILVGGGARSEAVRRIAPAILGTPVHVPTPAEYVALGAARQAAWTLSGADAPPSWTFGLTTAYRRRPHARGGRAVPSASGADVGPVNARRRNVT